MMTLTLLMTAWADKPAEPLILTERDVQRESCDRGEAKECTALGLRYREGRGAPLDPYFALELFAKGCDLGDATACVYRADAYRNGDGVTRNAGRAVELYTTACKKDNQGRACRALGEIHILGDGVERDAGASGMWYDQGCSLDDAESCIGAALSVERGDLLDADPARGRELLNKACQMHHARGCTLLGRRYLNGHDGASKSADNASAMYQAGCALQDPEACRVLGQMAIKGKGMPKDKDSARIYLTDACAWDDYEACRELAHLLRKTDEDAAIEAAKRGCELGDEKSCTKAERLVWRKNMKQGN